MRVPPSAKPDVQQAFRELHERLDKFVGNPNAGHPNARGKRWTNAGDAVAETDLVTLRQLNDAIDAATTTPTAADVAGAGDSGGGGGGGTGTCNATKPDYTAYVTAAKATLVGLAEDLSGPCGAFKIVKLAARNIQAVDNTVGLLAKSGGTQCVQAGQGYSTDILCFIDGGQYDILGDAGGANTPQFNFVLCGDPDLYRSPLPS